MNIRLSKLGSKKFIDRIKNKLCIFCGDISLVRWWHIDTQNHNKNFLPKLHKLTRLVHICSPCVDKNSISINVPEELKLKYVIPWEKISQVDYELYEKVEKCL